LFRYIPFPEPVALYSLSVFPEMTVCEELDNDMPFAFTDVVAENHVALTICG